MPISRTRLAAGARTHGRLSKRIHFKAGYFSSTLDNCEDKAGSVRNGDVLPDVCLEGAERRRYVDLCREAAFAFRWYYLWDVPFAGQMLGDVGRSAAAGATW